MGVAERIEWQRESPALPRSDHPCDTVGDGRETLLWWSQHPVHSWSEHPCDTVWDEVEPEICQNPANDNVHLPVPFVLSGGEPRESGTKNTLRLSRLGDDLSKSAKKAATSLATDQTSRTEEGSAQTRDIFTLARAVMAEGSKAGARAWGEKARPERRTRQGEAQPAQAQATLADVTFSDNRRAEQAGGWGLATEYDDLYRATRIRYTYADGDDEWKSPFQAENEADLEQSDPRRAKPSPHVAFQKRILQQTFEYDWLGNNEKTTDDAGGFYDRSLGDITNDSAGDKPYQLKSASVSGANGGTLQARYDAAGNMIKMALARDGVCLGGAAAGDCSQQFVYDWDEVGRLERARRWDNNLDSVDAFDASSAGTPAADLRHTYDASDQRVIKEAVDAQGEQSFTLYVFASLELRRAQYGTGFAESVDPEAQDYEVSHYTAVPYLMAGGVRLARLVYHGEDEVPEEDASPDGSFGDVNASVSNLHVFFELGDHLGSTSVVLDKATGELVERSTFQGYGGAESDYRPGRWKSFREDYKFTGKEEDVKVGLQYFGKRFLNPLLGRWVSADPLAVHAPGEADLNLYAYVSGQILRSIDPLGLEEKDTVKVTFVPDDVRAQADAAGIDPDKPGEGNSFAFRDNRNGKVLIYASDDPSALSRNEYEATHFRNGGSDADKGGSCAGAGVCGTAGPGQESVKGDLDITDGISQLDGAITEQSFGEEGGKKDGSIGGGCKSCEGTDLKQVIKSGVNAAVGAIGQVGALAVKWFQKVKMYRGGKPGQMPDLTPRPNDFKVDKATGTVKDSHGVSVFDNADSVSNKGLVPHEVDQSTIPKTLRIKQRGRDPSHHEITPAPDANLSPEEFVEACKGIRCK